MKPEDRIAQLLDFASYCYVAAERCAEVHHRDHFLSLAKGWEALARNLERDRKAINESRALLLRVEAQFGRRRP
jgi:hypothetical protein